jgi:DNA-binding transcriptional ArsR family regulator
MSVNRRLRDRGDLRALAHPLRLAILETLTVRGPHTATQLGVLLNESAANCSWHLRKLAEHGLVEEAPGGTGRQRPWRAAQRSLEWKADGPAPELAQAGQTLTRLLVDREVERLLQLQASVHQEDPRWHQASGLSQSMLWLTADELAEINSAIRAAQRSKIDRFDDPQARPEGSRLCAFVSWGIPATVPATGPTAGDTGVA